MRACGRLSEIAADLQSLRVAAVAAPCPACRMRDWLRQCTQAALRGQRTPLHSAPAIAGRTCSARLPSSNGIRCAPLRGLRSRRTLNRIIADAAICAAPCAILHASVRMQDLANGICPHSARQKEVPRVAIYHLNIRGISPARGASAIAAAAYQSGQILRDLATGEVCRYARQERVAETGIVLPDGAPAWAHDREALWNEAAEAWSEGSANRLMARRLVVALPRELSYPRMRECVERLCQTFAKDGHACDWAIHDAQSGNPHAHILISSNSMDAGGFVKAAVQKRLKLYICRRDGEERQIAAADWKSAKKDGWEKVFRYQMKDGTEARLTQSEAAEHGLFNEDRVTKTPVSITAKADGGSILEDAKSDLVALRASWAAIANAALDAQYQEEATPEKLQEHIDHRSNADRGIESVPTIHEGPSVTAMERRALREAEPVAATRVHDQNVQIHFHNYMIVRLRAQIVHLMARAAEARACAAARVRAVVRRARNFFLGVPPALDVPAAIEISSGIPAPASRIQEQQTPAREAVRVLAEAGADMARAGAADAEAAAYKLRDAKYDMSRLDMALQDAKLAAEEAARQSAAEAAIAAAQKARAARAEEIKARQDEAARAAEAAARAERAALERLRDACRPPKNGHQEAAEAPRRKPSASMARQAEAARQKAAQDASRRVWEEEYRRRQEALDRLEEQQQDQDWDWDEPER